MRQFSKSLDMNKNALLVTSNIDTLKRGILTDKL